VRTNAPDVLARELEALQPKPIKFCPVVSDPYQAVERRERLTRRCLDTIARASKPWPVLVLTRSTLILDDVDRLAALPIAFAGVSMPTIDDEVRRHFEPRAASIDERLEVLRVLRSAGVRTLAIVQPILAGPLEPLADALAKAVESVSIDVLHGVAGAEADFADPRYAMTREEAWQRDAALRLSELLGERGVVVWTTELPPPLRA
jgi:DNA repair photolyase